MSAMNATREYFGTDGIRGTAGHHPLTAGFTVNLGVALAELLGKPPGRARCLLGMHTRRSGAMPAPARTGGPTSRGSGGRLSGVVPARALACLTWELQAPAGRMIRAGRNPSH